MLPIDICWYYQEQSQLDELSSSSFADLYCSTCYDVLVFEDRWLSILEVYSVIINKLCIYALVA